MKDGCGCRGKLQEQEKPVDETFAEALVKGKRERQAVLKRVRKQRVLVLKRLAAKLGRLRP